MQGELYSALKNEEQTGSDSSTTFSGEMHFYELVEDTKDGIWLVQVSIDPVSQTFKQKSVIQCWGKLLLKKVIHRVTFAILFLTWAELICLFFNSFPAISYVSIQSC